MCRNHIAGRTGIFKAENMDCANDGPGRSVSEGEVGCLLCLTRGEKEASTEDVTLSKTACARPTRSTEGAQRAIPESLVGWFSRAKWGYVLLLVVLACSVISCLAHEEIHAPGASEIEEFPELKVADGFKVEKLYTVPPEQGSWISLAVDSQGRLIASAQSGLLYCVTPGAGQERTKVNPIRVFVKDEHGKPVGEPIGSAQGLLWAFDSLYVVINGRAGLGSGLYRLRSTRADGGLNQAQFLAALPGSGEHGPHGIALDPKGVFLYVTAGNDCGLPEFQVNKVPSVWGGDQLLSPHSQESEWHSKNGVVPGGWVCRTDPEGKKWEIYCSGFRNAYRMAFNPEGELFTVDGDNEWQIGLPWYRAPRILHVTGGGDFGWRNGNLKWPTYFPDGLGAVADLPKGGPSGIVMGTGTQFPLRYQQALFALDWAYGKIYVAHLKEEGSTYSASVELFLSGRPLAVADAVVGKDGALYFVVGGRGLDSGLFRITYTGSDPTDTIPKLAAGVAAEARQKRHVLEDLQAPNAKALVVAWPLLNSGDARLRSAARTVIEHQDPSEWEELLFEETQPQTVLTAAMALARCGAYLNEEKLYQKLNNVDWSALSSIQRVELLRTYSLMFIRMGDPAKETMARISVRLNAFYPDQDSHVNRELSRLLVYLGTDDFIEKTLALIETGPTQEDQMHHGWLLELVKKGWSTLQRDRYLRWVESTESFSGGKELHDLLAGIKRRFTTQASEDNPLSLPAKFEVALTDAAPKVAKDWTIAELAPSVKSNLHGRNFERGQRVYKSTACATCHYLKDSGTEVGPDLTHAAKRLNNLRLLESIIEPNKVIGDPYSAYTLTLRDGRKMAGRILCETNGKYQFLPDPLKPDKWVEIKSSDVMNLSKSAVSIMPEGLLAGCDREEILDLMAYLLSGGDSQDKVFKNK